MQHIELQAQAQALRNEGMSTRKIAAQLNVSQPWVTRHTKANNSKVSAAAPATQREQAVAQALAKATSQQGCNTTEFNSIIKSVYGVVRDDDTGHYGVDCSADEKKAIKRRVKDLAARDGKTALFFEDFINRANPVASLQLMLALANSVHEAVEQAVSEFQRAYPETTTYAVQKALQGMAIQGYRPESVEAYCERAAIAAHTLQQVAPAVEAVEPVTEHTYEFLVDLADIDAEMFGVDDAGDQPETEEEEMHAPMPKTVLAEAVQVAVIEWPVTGESVTEEVVAEVEMSLDDFDDEAAIDYTAVDNFYDQPEIIDDMDIDNRYERNEKTAQAVRDLFKQRAAERTERATGGKRPKDWALKQEAEDEFYAMLADAESHNENFIF